MSRQEENKKTERRRWVFQKLKSFQKLISLFHIEKFYCGKLIYSKIKSFHIYSSSETAQH